MMHSTLFLLSFFQMAITVLLAIAPFISATPSPSSKELHFRDPAVQQRDVIYSGWFPLGCYTDSPAQRTLTSRGYSDPSMTAEKCLHACQSQGGPGGYVYGGVEKGTDCYCGNVLTPGAVSAPVSQCSSKCVGDSSKTCGGSDHLSLYWNGQTPQPQPTFVQNVYPHWGIEGCFSDSITARTLSVKVSVTSQGDQDNNNVENCVNACEAAGYHYAGVEAADECWCGHSINNHAAAIDSKHCLLACPGKSTENCGGPNALVLYVYHSGD
ncbi:WSC domain-containing protein [Lactarius quietus]|nr:WSC domain-containing protein [Lactarius quietus]